MSTLSRNELEARIKSIIAEITGYDEKLLQSNTLLAPDDSSKDALSVDSLEFAELLITLDEEFKVHIPDQVARTFNTVDSLVNYIAQHSL